MIKGMIFLASEAFGSGTLGTLLSKWEQAGFFTYLLPFLLIFALVFGILMRIKVFKDNKVVNGIIALSVALMSLQFSFVPAFFSQIFPRLGVGLAIILGVLVITGLFADPDSPVINYVLLGIGVVIIGMVIIQAAGAVGWQSGEWWGENWAMVAGAIVLFILVAIVIGSAGGNQGRGQQTAYRPPYVRD